jgi:chromosome segregation ATPase
MGYQPHTRGRGQRFGRPVRRKTSSRERREQQGTSTFYQEREQTDPSELSLKVTNVLKHLGEQRFALPPYSEHFQRWLKDVQGILTELETELPRAADEQYRSTTQKILTEVDEGLRKRVELEKTSAESSSNLQKQLATTEIELTRLDNEYNKQSREIKRRHEKASQELRHEIDELGRQRLRLLHKKSGLLDRIFKRSETGIEEKTSSLQSRKSALGDRNNLLKSELEKIRVDREINRKRLLKAQKELRTKFTEQRENIHDDALEIRKRTCEELQRAVSEAVNRFLNQST